MTSDIKFFEPIVRVLKNTMFVVLIFFQPRVIAQSQVRTSSFKIANILQSNMVVQQLKPMRVWGTAPSGDRISIRADWMKRTVIVNTDQQGKWLGEISVPKALRGNFETHTITIIHRDDTVMLNNILIGEVWMCTGQSNITFMLGNVKGWGPGVVDYKKEVAAADYPYIRLIGINTAWEDHPQEDCKGEWKPCTPKTIHSFSAVAYYFGRELFKELQIPVGLVANGIAAAACQTFTARNVMEADSALKKKYVDPYDARPRKKDESIFLTLSRPSIIYNGMIYPIRHLSIRGFIWYQGNANVNDGMMYNKLCTAMLKGWRKDFDQGALPFYFVQMPPYNFGKNDPAADNLALFREVQTVLLKLKNTGMAVTMDSKEFNNLHPRDKKPVGIRLAKVALHKCYHYKNIAYQGPVFKKIKIEKDTVKIFFKPASIGNGLTTNDGQPPKYFYVAGTDKVFHKANARIEGNQVWVYSPEIHQPVEARYAFTNYPVTNFENKEGLPAWPFRTDKWQLYVHGGGFAEGTRKWSSIKLMYQKLAQRGYAVARADTSMRFISGESAGAVTSMLVGYVDKQKELAAYSKTNPYNIEGNNGNPGHSSNVKAVLCLCGMIMDTSAIESPKNRPLLWVHGSFDHMLPFSWASEIPASVQNVELKFQKIVFKGATHCPWYYGL